MATTETKNFVTAATINSGLSGGQLFLTVCFWIWGVLGLLMNGLQFLGLSGSIGVGTSAYMSACMLLWIGGMILSGLGAVIAGGAYEFRRPPV